jgi:hypothetical protein
MYHHTQLFSMEMQSPKLFSYDGLEPRSSRLQPPTQFAMIGECHYCWHPALNVDLLMNGFNRPDA